MGKRVQKLLSIAIVIMGLVAGCTAGGETDVSESKEVVNGTVGVLLSTSDPLIGGGKPVEPEGNQGGYLIRVDRTANCVTIYEKDVNGTFTIPVKHMICSVGTGENTPVGVFAISDQYRWRALFGGTYGQYASRITGNILFHSVPYQRQSENTLVPGAYNELGTKASQGCVRLTCADAKWIYENCASGTVVEIFDGPAANLPEKPEALYLDPRSPYCGWDPTDPSGENPWKKMPIALYRVRDLTVKRGSGIDLLEGVFALDVDGQTLLKVQASGEVDVNRCGSYTVKYTAVGATGAVATAYATVTVVE